MYSNHAWIVNSGHVPNLIVTVFSVKTGCPNILAIYTTATIHSSQAGF